MFGFVSKMKRVRLRTVLVISVLGVVFAGCGKSEPVGTVRGKVTLNDQPYTGASIMFLSLDTGQGGTAEIQPDGTFRIQTPLPVGSYTAFLEPKSIAPESLDPTAPGFEAKLSETDPSVPEKYWNEATSDITIQVTEGENEVTVPLKK